MNYRNPDPNAPYWRRYGSPSSHRKRRVYHRREARWDVVVRQMVTHDKGHHAWASWGVSDLESQRQNRRKARQQWP